MAMRTIGLLALSVVLSACQPFARTSTASQQAGQQTSALSAVVQGLVTAARDRGEKQLDLSWSEDTLGGSQGARKFEALFNRTYGLGVTVQFTPGPTMTDMAGKIAQEAAAGRTASTDVFIATESHFGALVDKQALEEVDYAALFPGVKPEMLVPKGIGVQFASRFPGITYNTDLIPAAEVPKKLEDLLNPKWKGRIASNVDAASFDRIAFRPEWSPDKMRAFVTKLSPNLGGLVRGGETLRVATGEFTILAMDGGSYQARTEQTKGAPVKHAILEDGAIAVFHYLGVPRSAAHPNLAKLFVHMILSQDGQKLLFDIAFYDHHVLPGSQSAAELSDLIAKGIKPLLIDPKFVLDHPEDLQLRDDLTKILRQRS